MNKVPQGLTTIYGSNVMIFKSFLRYSIILMSALIIVACATVPDETVSSSSSSSSTSIGPQVIDGIYVGSETVEMLAVDVPDRVFFAYDSFALNVNAQETLAKQAAWLKANGSVTVAIEGHADERGTREYNLALGDRRANAAKDYLMSQGISANRITTISFGKEKPVVNASNDKAWAQNRRSVTVRTN